MHSYMKPENHIYTIYLHDALPISVAAAAAKRDRARCGRSVFERDHAGVERLQLCAQGGAGHFGREIGSTRLNSSHHLTSYAVFCLKTKIRVAMKMMKLLSY